MRYLSKKAFKMVVIKAQKKREESVHDRTAGKSRNRVHFQRLSSEAFPQK